MYVMYVMYVMIETGIVLSRILCMFYVLPYDALFKNIYKYMIELRSMHSRLSRILYVIYMLPYATSFKSMYMYVIIEASIAYYQGYVT